jgi:serine O-acetyltransferase
MNKKDINGDRDAVNIKDAKVNEVESDGIEVDSRYSQNDVREDMEDEHTQKTEKAGKDKVLRVLDIYKKLMDGELINKAQEAHNYNVAERSIRRDIDDIKSFMEHDPAARSPIEIVLLYPGFKALQSHKRAKWFLNHNMPFIARYISQRSAHKTGIEIHPGATIGRRVCIDHGNGIVIGETTEIGDDVMIYQGVTLGGTGKDVGKRHPTIESGVMIGSGAKVLGPITVGRNAKVAAGAVVVKDVEPNCTVVGVPGEVVRIDGERVDDLDQINIPDPLMNLIRENQAEIEKLKEEIEKLKEQK